MKRSILLLVLVTTIGHGYLVLASGTEFVFDDKRFIEKNVAVHDLGNAARYFTDPTTVDPQAWTGIYRPLRTLDFAIDWAIAGPTPGWFHFRSLLLHVAATILVFFLLRAWGAGETGATIGALVFGVHPVQVEAVGWITSRGDLLCTVFFLAALLLHHRSRGTDRYFVGASALLALSLLSKEVAVMFPAAAFLADLFFRDERKLSRTMTRWRQYLTYAILAGIYFGIWTGIHVARDAPRWHLGVRWGGSMFGTLLTMSRGFIYYFRLILFPADMATDFYLKQVSTPDPLTSVCALFLLVLLGWSVYRVFRGGGAVPFAVLWLFITIFPASNIPAPIGITTAERFLYLPMVGVAFLAARLFPWFWRRGRPAQILVGVFVAAMTIVTIDRTEDWKTERDLWLATLGRFESPRGLDWRADTSREKAAIMLERAEKLEAAREEDAARELERKADQLLRKAERDCDRSIELWRNLPVAGPSIAVVRANRALVWFTQGRIQLALGEANDVLRTPVIQLLARANLVRALCLHALGHHRAASWSMENALEFDSGPYFRKKAAAIYQDLARWYREPEHENLARVHQALRRSYELLPDPVVNQGVFDALEEVEKQMADALEPRLEQVEKKTADGQVYLDIAILLSAHGFYERADPTWRQLLAQPELAPEVRQDIEFAYARYFWETRDTLPGYDEAFRIYRALKAKNAEYPGLDEAIEQMKERRNSLLEELNW